MKAAGRTVPFFSQWETPELTEAVLAEGAAAALSRDPHWQASGAHSLEEYVTWANNACGMACLKMVLAAYTGRIVPTLDLARRCTAYGGYTVNEAGEIKGLIYAPFVEFVREGFGIDAEVVTGITTGDLPPLLQSSDFFIASVHPSIRWADREPPGKGGILSWCSSIVRKSGPGFALPTMLSLRVEASDRSQKCKSTFGSDAFAAGQSNVTFHNPSGHIPESQAHAVVPAKTFDRFFAGRGIAIRGMRAA